MENNFVTVNYEVRDSLGISNNEYVACYLIYQMSKNTGWAEISRTYLAERVGISERGLLLLLGRMEAINLIERNAQFKFKTTSKWIKAIN